ncbi:MAG: Benzoate--CoA ligase [Alphaproteobacteria bacterium MarineAlpha11_Bin1]|nr:MAG: Benzoate--CoA ligase [Alphaproteobacteria bacterium MarineAlpha11_Bin1]|tara:strand:+ start:16205 stop:17863 length:1659 start_codon:yes stop_codon:yes gene_type:complete
MGKHLPGGPTSHIDTFAADNLPSVDQWPEFDFDALPILQSYPDRINAGVELLDQMCETGFGENSVVHYEDTTWTYNELRGISDRIARVLVEDHGLVPGNRVLLRSANNPMLVACWCAVLKAGGICVTTMQLLRARELVYIVKKAEIRHALCDIALAEEMRNTCQLTPELESTLYFTATGDGETSLDHALSAKTGGFENCDTAADDTALIAFTSGTTGSPKATMHFHRDVMAMTDCFPRSFAMAESHDIFTGTPPLAFTFGLGGLTCFPMRFGASTRFFPGPLGPEDMMVAIEKYKITGLYTAPTMYRQLADLADKYDISSLKKCVSAGETLPGATWDAFFNATGIRIVDGLGSTEMIHIFVSASPTEMRSGFTGKAIPGYRAKIVDQDGNELPPNTPGLLAVQGPTGCRYLADERQGVYVKNGWNYPGDIYEMDEDGYFKYIARADDMIISAGYNISGPEVENALLDHRAVAECAVIGKPDEKRTNIVKAFVVLRGGFDAGAETEKILQEYVKNEIAPYKYPREIEFVDELPKTETGKLQRFRLRDREQAVC